MLWLFIFLLIFFSDNFWFFLIFLLLFGFYLFIFRFLLRFLLIQIFFNFFLYNFLFFWQRFFLSCWNWRNFNCSRHRLRQLFWVHSLKCYFLNSIITFKNYRAYCFKQLFIRNWFAILLTIHCQIYRYFNRFFLWNFISLRRFLFNLGICRYIAFFNIFRKRKYIIII